ncbi:prepilin-type N-terminal cleavage/methylation domain-containing protein [Neiella sp. HB171785]|uniref:Prepilin-type N-terminal cleavage/methylation domain-containing protein n=1 Tax=Neiella litorisoli TaxID=2771431 RepID=A0A8J6QKM4_9GAMM|nr:prepilin-type N-terminal cleavage/methylation domain-containing protein [Neiella litorisoli]MBD1389802.1 prepilin-type N-terminal cleavage/methylation domain-containing protein [Neiella litorisoli]
MKYSMRNHNAFVSRGFSLIEAMVALVVLSLVFTAIWNWMGVAANSTQRIEQTLAMPELFEQFIAHMELENLQTTREGEFDIGDYRLVWQATEARRSDQEYYRRQPFWLVVLFDVNVEVSQADRVVARFDTQIVRYWEDPNFFDPMEMFNKF